MVRPCCAIRVVFDENFFFSPSWTTDYFQRSYLRAALIYLAISYPRRIQTSSDGLYSYTGMHPHSQMSWAIFCMIAYSLITYARIFLCIYQWNCVLEIASWQNLSYQPCQHLMFGQQPWAHDHDKSLIQVTSSANFRFSVIFTRTSISAGKRSFWSIPSY